MLIRVYTCQNAKLLEITCHGSYVLRSVEGEVGTISVTITVEFCLFVRQFDLCLLVGYRVYSRRFSLVCGSLRYLVRVRIGLRTILSIE